MKRGAGAAAGAEPNSKRSKKNSLLLHQNGELAFSLKLAKQELATVSASSRKSADRLTSRLSSLDRAWRAVAARLCLAVTSSSSSSSSSTTTTTTRIPSGSSPSSLLLSKYVLSSVMTGRADEKLSDDEDEDGNVDFDEEYSQELLLTDNLSEDEFDRELKQRLQDTLAVLEQQQQQGASWQVASQDVLAARVELLREKLYRSRRRVDQVTTQLEEEKNNSWRLTRRLELVSSEQQQSSTAATAATTGSSGLSSPSPTLAYHSNGHHHHSAPPPPSSTPQLQLQPPPPPSGEPPATAAAQLLQHEHQHQQLLFDLNAHQQTAQDMAQLAQSRLEAIRHLEQRVLQLQQQQPDQQTPQLLSPAYIEHAVQLELEQRELRTGRVAEEALERLQQCEHVVQDLAKASLAISTAQESVVRKENAQLRGEVAQLRQALVSLQQLSSKSAANDDLIALLRSERSALQAQLASQRETGGGGGNEEEGLIGEIENLNHALNVSRDANAKLQLESETMVRRLAEEKHQLERDLREMQEEKNLHLLRSDKMQQILAENEQYVVEHVQQQVERERQNTERAEDLCRRATESCERAVQRQEELQQQIDALLAQQSVASGLEAQLAQVALDQHQRESDLVRVQEEAAVVKRRLDRSKAQVELLQEQNAQLASALAAASSAGAPAVGGALTSSSQDAIRLQAMNLALHCPVYKDLWKDCVITKCAHMFSRKCLEDNLANRSRRCPTCKNQYSKDDLLTVYLYQTNN